MIMNNFSERTKKIIAEAEAAAKEEFLRTDEVALFNQAKVLSAFSDNRISAAHLRGTTGYGYDDMGRDALDKVYAAAFEAEDAIVRMNLTSGTQAIATALFAVLRPGDKLLAVTGKPYDTFDGVIGLDGSHNGSLMDFGVKYDEIPLKEDGRADIEAICDYLSREKVKMIHIQRSRGYGW